MKVVHISDWHGEVLISRLPFADMYICTGDMLPNYPLIHKDGFNRVIDPDREEREQKKFIENRTLQHIFSNPLAPIIVIRGNHDFVDLSDYIGKPCFEISKDPSRVFTTNSGFRIGGVRGISYIEGEWADELRPHEMSDRVRAMPPDLDILVTHMHPSGFCIPRPGYVDYGSGEISNYILCRSFGDPPLRAHFFGHAHDTGGKTERRGDSLLSNAATASNIVYIEVT